MQIADWAMHIQWRASLFPANRLPQISIPISDSSLRIRHRKLPHPRPPHSRTRSLTGTHNPSKPVKPSAFPSPPLSLESFLLRQRVLSLWRDIVRLTNKIPGGTSTGGTRRELRQYARHGFERHRGKTDRAQIRFLVSTGRTELQGMRRYVDELAG